ncbi:MAG: RNA polymerase sporulation sigma factor SigF [Alkaliphilus sp.]|nr:MAG: RNA polymerase sporulation sigma factor SigF [Alkaliphilus sp.]
MNLSILSSNQNRILEHEETIDFIIKSQSGDLKAQEMLVTHNLGLIRSVMKRFVNRGYDKEDIFQIGCIGLIKAIKKFDINYEVKFSTYAVPMIIGEIKRFMRDDGMIKVSRALKQTATKIKYSKEEFSKKYGRDPTLKELAEDLNIAKEEIVIALESSIQPDYLHDVIYQDDGDPVYLVDKIEDKNTIEDEEIIDKILLKNAISKLGQRERQIIVLRYFKDKTQTEIAKILGVSQVQVSRIEKKILGNMKIMMKKLD